MKIKTNRTSIDYRFTVDLNNPKDVKLVKQLKELVKQTNKSSWKQQRVCLKGRLGKDNPMAYKYKGNPCYTVAMADAAYFDVYVYFKSN